MKRIYLILFSNVLSVLIGFAQYSDFYFLGKQQIKELNINEIEIDECNCFFNNASNQPRNNNGQPEVLCSFSFDFESGRLEEMSSIGGHFRFGYDTDNDYLVSYKLMSGFGWRFVFPCHYYNYSNNKLTSIESFICNNERIEKIDIAEIDTTGIDTDRIDIDGIKINEHEILTKDENDYFIETEPYKENVGITKYFYYPDGKLQYSTERIFYDMYNNNDSINTMYYLYKNNCLIGYYPAKTKSYYGLTVSDTIYNDDKLLEIKTIGFEKLSEKYLHGELLKKVIDDCYEPVKSEQLLINGKPIKEFLMSIGKSDAQYIILEVADNYFLYYKII
jgi:hypothetical protein